MKKLFLTLLTVMCISPVFADQFDEKGLVSGWKFAPLQLGILPKEYAQLFDGSTHCLGAFSLLGIKQTSAVISMAPFNELHSNYGIQISTIQAEGSNNYGISFGFYTSWQKNYAIQIGVLNNIENILGGGDRLSFVGTNIADFIQIGMINSDVPVQCGLINGQDDGYFQAGAINYGEKNSFQLGLLNACVDSKIQIALVNGGGKGILQIGLYNVQENGVQVGLFNLTPGKENFKGKTSFQIGLLNYNPKSYIPWLPLVNWDMGREEK